MSNLQGNLPILSKQRSVPRKISKTKTLHRLASRAQMRKLKICYLAIEASLFMKWLASACCRGMESRFNCKVKRTCKGFKSSRHYRQPRQARRITKKKCWSRCVLNRQFRIRRSFASMLLRLKSALHKSWVRACWLSSSQMMPKPLPLKTINRASGQTWLRSRLESMRQMYCLVKQTLNKPKLSLTSSKTRHLPKCSSQSPWHF